MASTTRARRIIGRTLKFVAPWLEIRQTYNTGELVSTTYMVCEVAVENGRAFDLTRRDDAAEDGVRTYRVRLYGNGGASCQHEDGTVCPSFGYSRGQRCKHTDAVRKCVELSK